MTMKITPLGLPGVLLLDLACYQDERGAFAELFVAPRYAQAGISKAFVQDNYSYSKQGVLRGLHFQHKNPQGKLVTVSHGHIWDVVADIDPASATYGKYIAVDLQVEPGQPSMQQLWIPPGYAHGFCVMSDSACVIYKCTDVYQPDDEAGVVWNDPQLNIPWPVSHPLISPKDQSLPTLAQWALQSKESAKV